ncbi:MAG: aldehyde ferredoxin oxidoreductase family protein [Candidatus Bathyarchaeia archaeon]
MLKYKAYGGKIIRVNLNDQKIVFQSLTNDFTENFLGGSGFISKTLWSEVNASTDPLSPDNKLIFAVGPLCGTGWPQACRFSVGAKSPLTGIYGDSSCCGFFGPELKFAGYDMIVFEGRAEKPVYLFIDDEEVGLKDAKHLWGKLTSEVNDTIREEVGGSEVQVVCCGPAGENLVKFAGIIHHTRAAARCGLGAIMGSKNLKAVAVRGSKSIELAYPDRFYEFVEEIITQCRESKHLQRRKDYGTTILVELMNEIARWPVRNFQTGYFPYAKEMGGEIIREKYRVKDRGSFSCLSPCEKPLMIKEGSYKGIYEKNPEYETLSAIGARCGIHNLDAIIYANKLCNDYGIDTISLGGTISWLMECYEKGVVKKEDLDGLDLSWGNEETLIKLVHKIAKREGIGNLLAEGSFRAAQAIGKGSEKYLMHVKKQEIPAQDGRAQKSMGLAQAVASRGADHLKAFPLLDETIREEFIIKRYGKEYLPEMANRLDPKYKPFLVKDGEELCALCDSLSLCKSSGTALPLPSGAVYYPDMAKAVSLATGMEIDAERIKIIGERIVNLQRAFNIREGISRKDDALPERFTKTPAPEGPPKGHVVELEKMLDEYYELRGWDKKTGLIPKEKLEKLGLGYVAEELEKLGKLP